MCAQFMLKASLREIEKAFNLHLDPESELWQWPEKILPHGKSPVVVGPPENLHLKLMKFSLVPSWAKEPKVAFATHNARWDGIDTKATWKNPLVKHRCVIPLTHFIEPIYLGDWAGHMVAFHSKTHEILRAAGIYDVWVNKETGEVLESFAIVTHEPSEFIKKTGHDRQPVFLTAEGMNLWLNSQEQDRQNLKNLLVKHQAPYDWAVTDDRPMRPGWEKRIPKV